MPACGLGFARFTVSRMNAKAVPVSTALLSTRRAMSFTVTVRFSIRGSSTHAR